MDQLVEAVGGAAREEWEMCFEYYLHSAEEIGLEATRQLEALEDLETSMSLSLSSRRLELEKLGIYLDVIGSGLSFGALLTGAFGMNLMSGLESRRLFFWPVCAGIAVSCTALCAAMRLVIRRRLRRQSASALWVPRVRAKSKSM
ncbi:unnamed protein product [Prorocentrum cordatum]|uniref:Magnesium transporter n=1 Tax=Prorocentrum cordatum TaxID=2364126 RepID=A0ABN9U6I9_9DINO|nr:unnamed protein product [Polarella glacialis]